MSVPADGRHAQMTLPPVPISGAGPELVGRQWSIPVAASGQFWWPPAVSSRGRRPTTLSAGEMTDQGQPHPPSGPKPRHPSRLSPVLGEPCGLSTFPQRLLLTLPLDRGPPPASPCPRHSLRGPRWSLVSGNRVVPSYWQGWSLLRGKRHRAGGRSLADGATASRQGPALRSCPAAPPPRAGSGCTCNMPQVLGG
jgi:hypothetical protein